MTKTVKETNLELATIFGRTPATPGPLRWLARAPGPGNMDGQPVLQQQWTAPGHQPVWLDVPTD